MNFAGAWPVILTRIIAAFCLVFSTLAQRAVAAEVALEDNSLRIAFDTDSGALTRFEAKSSRWIIDEACHHGPVQYEFATGHGYVPPGYIYAGDLPLSRQLRAAADKLNPDFLFCGEGPQDWLMQYFPVSETGVSATPVCQYIDSHCLMLAGVSGFDDREMLNQILLYRYVIQYEPYYFQIPLRSAAVVLEQ